MDAADSVSKKREGVKVLFVYSGLSTFVSRDLNILRRHFTVKPMKAATFLVPKPGRNPVVFLRLLKGVGWADVVFSWFANLNAFFIVLFCMILRKKSVIVAGGYDVANIPEIGYGAMGSLLISVRGRFALKMATKVLAVSKSNREEILRCASPRDLKFVYNGVPVERFKPSGPKENLVVTVGPLSSERARIKGLETFIKASTYLPNVDFVLIGKHEDQSVYRLKSMADSNLTFTGFLPIERILRYFQRAKVYCQLSAYESFGVALAEAMACCCVPVVTKRYAIPEVVGGTGFYVPYNNPKATAEAIKKALNSDKGVMARERIKRYYSLRARERKLVKEVLDIMSTRKHSGTLSL